MKIFVKTVNGKLFQLELERCDTIKHFKKKLQEKEGIPYQLQRLSFNGRELGNNINLYDIEEGSIFELVKPKI